MGNDGLGKEAENQIKRWLDRPEDGYSFDRLFDQMNGFYGSKNICDFTCYRYPYYYYIESKATWEDRFDFSMISDNQHDKLLEKSKIPGVFCLIIVLFASYKRAFVFRIEDIDALMQGGVKSLNIKKIDKWSSILNYKEIKTIPNSRRKHLDYQGELEDYIPQ